MPEQSEKWAHYYKQRDDSIMSDCFEGQLMNRTVCLSCGHQALAFDNFMDLSLEIPRKAVKFTGSIKIQDCLDKFIESEKLIDCGYKCEACKKNSQCGKGFKYLQISKDSCHSSEKILPFSNETRKT